MSSGLQPMGGVYIAAGGQSPEWFGNTDESGCTVDEMGGSFTTANSGQTFTCPGTGSRTITKLSAYTRVPSSTYRIRMAVYTAAGALVGQAATYLDISNTTAQWNEQTVSIGVTGGTNYVLALSGYTSNVRVGYFTGHTSDDWKFNSTDRTTGGFPSTLDVTDDLTDWILVKAYVE